MVLLGNIPSPRDRDRNPLIRRKADVRLTLGENSGDIPNMVNTHFGLMTG